MGRHFPPSDPQWKDADSRAFLRHCNELLKQRGWRDQHILVVSEEDERLDFVEREFVRRLGERLYGGRSHG